ncbi:MAG: acyl-CoA thioesterase [Bacteroidales bacterium]|nr:acyl-CoA thioesterase [Bacteroidales bacterium]
MDYQYELKMKVRDYECDLQGIVNNANYQHYTEHARHEFLLANGVSFSELHDKGIDAVVARITIDFKSPLRSRDEFVCRLRLERQGIKYVFFQDIYRLPDEKLAIKARVDTVCVQDGQLVRGCDELNRVFFPDEVCE